MSAKAAILGRIRSAIEQTGIASDRKAVVAERLATSPRGVMPTRGALPERERLALFRSQAEAVSATVDTIASYDDLPAAVAAYLRERNLPAIVRMGDDARLRSADWHREATLEVLEGATDGNDLAGVSHAFGAIAETGTLALLAGSDNPTTINFLPEYHIAVLSADDVVGDMETIWDRLRARYGKGVMTRVVNFVTGPSRSADIEQTILLGAHGPRALHIVIVDQQRHVH
jgi:L-lactate dehydrogenase complex protein LldG